MTASSDPVDRHEICSSEIMKNVQCKRVYSWIKMSHTSANSVDDYYIVEFQSLGWEYIIWIKYSTY